MNVSFPIQPKLLKSVNPGSVVGWITENSVVYGLRLGEGAPAGLTVLRLSAVGRRAPGHLASLDLDKLVMEVSDTRLVPEMPVRFKDDANSAPGELEIWEDGRRFMKARSPNEATEDLLVDLGTGDVRSPLQDGQYQGTNSSFPMILGKWKLFVQQDPARDGKPILLAERSGEAQT